MIQTIVSWFSALFAYIRRFFEWFTGIFMDFMEFIIDLPIEILDGFLDGVIYLLEKIPVPDFLDSGGLQSIFDAFHPDILYLVGFFGLHYGLAIYGSALIFRLTRKALTLGQW